MDYSAYPEKGEISKPENHARQRRCNTNHLSHPGADLAAFSVGGLLGGLAVLRNSPPRACRQHRLVPWSFPPAMLALGNPLFAIAAVAYA